MRKFLILLASLVSLSAVMACYGSSGGGGYSGGGSSVCGKCNGNGRDYFCDGTGRISSGTCYVCDGDGRCSHCDGRGY